MEYTQAVTEEGFAAIEDFVGARSATMPTERLTEVRKRGEAFRERFLDQPILPYFASFDLLRIPYPRSFAYGGVYAQSLGLQRLVQILNRVFVIQFRDFNGKLKTLLFSPSDHFASETPYFERIEASFPKWVIDILAPRYNSVESVLEKLALKPEQIDYISYDHLHTQNLRRWLGTPDENPVFPNAKLLVHDSEWASTKGLLPTQADWYSTEGIEGVSEDKIFKFRDSLHLGPGIALLHTPGHTYGNHSLVARVPDGIRISSENGVASDSYAPRNSRRKAIRTFAEVTGAEVILNSNTLESSVDQYISMVLEATIAGPSQNSDFPNVTPSSECVPHVLFPGSGATHLFGTADFGTLTHRCDSNRN